MVDRDYITKVFEEIKKDYPELFLLDAGSGAWLLRGNLHFCRKYKSTSLEDAYIVEIIIPTNFPYKIPKAKEVGGRIPRAFHTNLDNTLCLGTPLQSVRSFSRDRTLSGFIENCLIPFFFTFSCKEQSGKLPYGEWPHGFKGIIECYKEEFQTDDIKLIVDFLRILAMDNFPAFDKCPCHSGKRLLKCHGEKILELKNLREPEDFASELKMILDLS